MTNFLIIATLLVVSAPETTSPIDHNNLMVYQDADGTMKPVKKVDDWEKRRTNILTGMQEVMGLLPERENIPLDMQIREERDFPEFVLKKITFAVESWDRLPALLLIPKGLKQKAPAMLCLHPTNAKGKDVVIGQSNEPNRNYAEELAKRGYITLAPDYPGFGEYVAVRKMLHEKGYASCTMKGIVNHRRCIDLLRSLPEVDGNRIGCIGHSLGGHNTLFAGAFDERIKVLVTSCGFTSFAKYKGGDLTGWTHDGYMPRIASVYGKDHARMPFDFTEVLAVLAPRALFINAPLHDDNFDVSGVDDCVNTAKQVYRLYDSERKLQVLHPDCGHDFPPDARMKAYEFIDQILKNAN